MSEKALIAMSGGVDSSVAAYFMKQAGYDCIGVTMKLFHNEDAGVSRAKSCCSLDDVEDARSVAHRLGIPYYVFNFTADFREQVMQRFVCAYENGATPNPCIDCNRYLKFDRLYHRARLLGCDCVVTGHYARIRRENGRFLLQKALDPSKDQSYVLYAMTQKQLSRTLFPLGDLAKSETRRIAESAGFVNADKPDSQDICFVPDGNYAKIIELHMGHPAAPGNFIDPTGKVLGKHAGIIRYTVGQHRGLGIDMSGKRYVCAVNAADNTVTLGEAADLMRRDAVVNDFNWIAGEAPASSIRCKAKLRYRQVEQPAVVTPRADGSVEILFDEPQRAVTPGQAAVLYDGDIVLGGGTVV